MRRVAVIAAVALSLFAVGALLFTSWRGTFYSVSPFLEERAEELPAKRAIVVRVTMPRGSSYFIGETTELRVQVFYRPALAKPDKASLFHSIDFSPLEERGFREEERVLGEGISEYIRVYELQAVNVEPGETHRFPFLSLTYEQKFSQEKRAIIRRLPPVHIAEYYPGDLTGIMLQPPKGAIETRMLLKRGVYGGAAAILLFLVCFWLWRTLRKRSLQELSRVEQFYLEFSQLRDERVSSRAYLKKAGEIFLALLSERAGIGAREFWSGRRPSDPFWRQLTEQAREPLDALYSGREAPSQHAAVLAALLEKAFARLRPVMKIEQNIRRYVKEPGLWDRFFARPKRAVLQIAALCLIGALIALSVQPLFWQNDVFVYNQAIKETHEFSAAEKEIKDPKIRSLALYNKSTLRVADTLFSRYGPHIYTTLFSAESDLREAVRLNPNDEDIRKNLELVIKIRRQAEEELPREEMFPPFVPPFMPGDPPGDGADEHDF